MFYVGETREKLGPGYYLDLIQRKATAHASDPSTKQVSHSNPYTQSSMV